MVTDIKEGYKSTEIGVIPFEWDLKSVEEISDVTTGNKDTQNKSENGIYDFYVRSQKVEKINSYSFDGEAVLTAGDGVGVGKVYHYVNGKFDYHQRVYKISGFKNIDGKFFFYYFSENFMKVARKYNSKTSVDSVRRHMITEMKIPIPSMLEQKRIVEVLSAADEQIEKTEQLINKTNELKITLMHKIFTEGINHTSFESTKIGKIPSKWEINRLDNLTTLITDGSHFSPIEVKESKYKIATVKNMLSNEFDIANLVSISEEDFENLKRNNCSPQKGDILLSKDGTIGKSFVYTQEEELVLLSSIAIVRPKFDKINPFFISQFLKSPYTLARIIGMKSGSAIKRIVLKDIKGLNVVVPPLLEQEKIADILLSIDNQIEIYEREKQKQMELKKALVQQLLTGKLRVTV